MQTFVEDHLHVRWTRRHENTDWRPGFTDELSLTSRYKLFPHHFLKILIKSKPQFVVHVNWAMLKCCSTRIALTVAFVYKTYQQQIHELVFQSQTFPAVDDTDNLK